MAELRKAATTEAQEHELGDALAALVNIARWLDLDAETALRKANHRFAERFATMQRLARQRGLEFSSLSLEQMDQLWEEAKDLLSSGGP
jgi:tetrapyrrole methylase family protein/MazG family protein